MRPSASLLTSAPASAGVEEVPRMTTRRTALKRRRTTTSVECPFCGEVDDLFVDAGGGDAQVYVEDCAVCCRPRVVHVERGDAPGEVRVWLERGE